MFFTATEYNFSGAVDFCRRIPASGAAALSAKAGEADDGANRRRALRLVDRALAKRQYKTALSLVKQLQGKSGGLRAFGAAKQITKRHSTSNEPELNGIDISSLRPLVDSVLDSIQRSIQASSLHEISVEKLEKLISEYRSDSRYEEEHVICAQHEAGHFLVGYLLGVLPKEYKVPSIQDLSLDKSAQGKVAFLGFEFLQQIDSVKILGDGDFMTSRNTTNKGRISTKTLNQFSCVILGGVVAELLLLGSSYGHHADVSKLESVLRWVGFQRSEAELHLEWAATNTAFIMSRHNETRSRLAEAMALGKSIGTCIDTIEQYLLGKDI